MDSQATAAVIDLVPDEEVEAGLTYQQALSAATRWMESTGEPASKVIDEARLGLLSTEALMKFARVGWISEVASAFSQARSHDGAPVRRIGGIAHAAGGRNRRLWDSPLDMKMVGADGKLKMFRDFTMVDLQDLKSVAATRKNGWLRREELAASTAALLKNHKAETVGGLPPRVLKDVEKDAAKAFSGGAQ